MWPAGHHVAQPLEGRVCDAHGCSPLSVRTQSPCVFIWCGSLWSDVLGRHCVSDHSCGTLALQVVAVSRPPHPWPHSSRAKRPACRGQALTSAALSCVASREDRVCSGPKSQRIPMKHLWSFAHNQLLALPESITAGSVSPSPWLPLSIS